ncbi:MAG: PAS domain-containing protein, partial [Bosea sp. (in: a-proteobacteria)]|nr:PAS domain-containing protein [Bosea sp. (in: a-proteobacteria)]
MQLTYMQAVNTERAFVAMSSAPPRDQTATPQATPWPGGLSPFLRDVIASAADIALLLDGAGVIVAAIGDGETWIGRAFPDVVSPDSRAKAVGLTGDDSALATTASEINHPGPDGTQRSFRYHRVTDGGSGLHCLIGRDLFRVAALQNRLLDAQQAMEREYARLRLAETRYRIIFHSSPEPILVADAATLRLIEANPAALAELDLQPDRLGRITLPSLFSPMSSDALETMLASARHSGVAGEVEVSRPGTAHKTAIRAIAFRQEAALHLLVRLRRPEIDAVALGADASLRHVHGMVEQTPDGCVI